jgi:hypothetical protein
MDNKDFSKETNQNSNSAFFCDDEVGISGYAPIETRFLTLINSKCEAPFDWYKGLGLDKSDASKIRRGLLIPPEWLRIKIAHYFGVDSSTIWKVQDLPYIKEILKKQTHLINPLQTKEPGVSEISSPGLNSQNKSLEVLE